MTSLLAGIGDKMRAGWHAERFRPAAGPAVRATLALVVPLVAARVTGRAEMGMWAGLAAFNLTLAGNEGPYRLRAAFMGRGMVFLTIMLVMLLESLGPVGWDLVAARAGNNVLGGALAVAAGYLMWPRWERRRVAETLAAALRAEAAYVCATAEALAAGAGLSAAVVAARRSAEITAADAAASYQRMLAEPARQRRNVALGLALVTYADRLTRALTALTARLPALAVTAAPPGLAQFAADAGDALLALAQAIESGGPVPDPASGWPAPQLAADNVPQDGAAGAADLGRDGEGAEPADRRQVCRLLRQVAREITEMQSVLRHARPSAAAGR